MRGLYANGGHLAPHRHGVQFIPLRTWGHVVERHMAAAAKGRQIFDRLGSQYLRIAPVMDVQFFSMVAQSATTTVAE
jgi:hypothetical protein